jgi:hypothetical protein
MAPEAFGPAAKCHLPDRQMPISETTESADGRPRRSLRLFLQVDGRRFHTVLLEDLGDCDLSTFSSTDHFYVFTSWYVNSDTCRSFSRLLEKNSGIDRHKVNLFLNSTKEYRCARRELRGINCLLVSKNCFIDENTFRITADPKIYAAVLNAGPWAYKRHHLSREVRDIARLFGHWEYRSEQRTSSILSCIRDNSLEYRYANIDHSIWDRGELVKILNQCRTGLCLSRREGQCQASSEYLLCGLPVVSTPSEGGRDYWYNDDNSVICDDDPAAVARGVELAIRRLDSGDFDPREIRKDHVRRSVLERKKFSAQVQRALDHEGIAIDAERYLQAIRFSPAKSARWVNEQLIL